MPEVNDLSRFQEFGKKIIGFSRTHRNRAKELDDPNPKEPVVFLKPTTSYVAEGSSIKLPKRIKEIQHAVEMGVVIGKRGKEIPVSEAMDYVGGYCVTLDMTDRALQVETMKNGFSWCIPKGFDTACPTSQLIPHDRIADPQNVWLWLKVNGVERQRGNTRDMLRSVAQLVSWISQHFTLEAGDLLLTGTPGGVGNVRAGDVIECGMDDHRPIASMTFHIKE